MIRYLEEREKLNIISLYEQCFDDEEEYKKYFFDKVLPGNKVLVYDEDNELKGMIHLIEKNIVMGREKISCNYLYGIATDEKYRRQGVLKKCMTKALEDMLNNKECFTYLIPSSKENADIYKKYGFEFVMNKAQIKPANSRKKPTHSVVCRNADKSDVSRMSIFATKEMEKRFGVYLDKDKEYFERVLQLMNVEKGKIVLYFEKNVVLGYRIGFEDEVVEEILDNCIKSMTWQTEKMQPYVMARIIDIPNTLKAIGTDEEGQVVIKIIDPVIKENHGTFVWKFQSGKTVWEKTDAKVDVEVTIGEFTAHIFNYKKLDKLPRMNIKNGFFINDYL